MQHSVRLSATSLRLPCSCETLTARLQQQQPQLPIGAKGAVMRRRSAAAAATAADWRKGGRDAAEIRSMLTRSGPRFRPVRPSRKEGVSVVFISEFSYL